jgi:hypothetical protein
MATSIARAALALRYRKGGLAAGGREARRHAHRENERERRHRRGGDADKRMKPAWLVTNHGELLFPQALQSLDAASRECGFGSARFCVLPVADRVHPRQPE